MKRIISLILTSLLCMLCACSKAPSKNQPEKQPAPKKVETLSTMIDVDYATFREKYGAPLYACNYSEGPSYRFSENGPWFTFGDAPAIFGPGTYTEKDEEVFREPYDSSTCIVIRATVSDWLGVSADNIKDIEDVKQYSGIKEFEEKYNYMKDENLFVGKTDKCTVTITEYMGKVNGESFVMVKSNLK